MKKKPIIVVVIGVLYLLAPLFYIGQICVYRGINPLDIGQLSLFITPYSITLMLLAIVVGIGVFGVYKWGFYVFILHSLFIIVANVVALVRGFSIPKMLLAGGIVFTLILVFVILKKNIIAPFFNPRLRWWKVPPRYLIEDAYIKADNKEAEIYDINENGCFLKGDFPYKPGDKIEFSIIIKGIKINSKGNIVWINKGESKSKPNGIGIKFIQMDRKSKKELKNIIRNLKRYGKESR